MTAPGHLLGIKFSLWNSAPWRNVVHNSFPFRGGRFAASSPLNITSSTYSFHLAADGSGPGGGVTPGLPFGERFLYGFSSVEKHCSYISLSKGGRFAAGLPAGRLPEASLLFAVVRLTYGVKRFLFAD